MISYTPFLEITLITIGLAFAIALIYRVLTNPDDVRKIKQDMKFYKEKMNEANKAGNKEQSSHFASEMMKASQKQMKTTMRPMMATMILFLLLLGWLHGAYGGVTIDFNIDPDGKFSRAGVDHDVTYEELDGTDGINFRAGIDFNDDGSFSDNEMFNENEIFEYQGLHWGAKPAMEGFFPFMTAKENAINFELYVAKSPVNIPYIGSYLSWFWWYIFISIPASMIFRKMLGVE